MFIPVRYYVGVVIIFLSKKKGGPKVFIADTDWIKLENTQVGWIHLCTINIYK